jgi:small subunit ribosomal protein S9
MNNKRIQVSGTRKRAIARAVVRQGKGLVHLNNRLLATVMPKMIQLRVEEPLLLADKLAQEVDIEVHVSGGGVMSQADAARLAIARGLLAYSNSPALRQTFLEYDRQLLVADVRQKETRKPNCNGKARAKRQKSYR